RAEQRGGGGGSGPPGRLSALRAHLPFRGRHAAPRPPRLLRGRSGLSPRPNHRSGPLAPQGFSLRQRGGETPSSSRLARNESGRLAPSASWPPILPEPLEVPIARCEVCGRLVKQPSRAIINGRIVCA